MPDGSLHKGPVIEGTPTSVSIPIDCPSGANFEVLWHSHPGGVSFPSEMDLRSGRDVGAKTLCITSEKDGLKCFKIEA